MERPVSFCRLPRDRTSPAGEDRVRLILENSTVCLISRRISLLCPVDIGFGWCRGFFDNDSGGTSFLGVPSLVLFSQGMWLLLIVAAHALVWVVDGFRWRV